MRLWSLHPKYLDTIGLVSLWREGLLAQNVLTGNTKFNLNHPQLHRFREHKEPIKAIGNYLYHIQQEAITRNFQFNINKIKIIDLNMPPINVTNNQMMFELTHLQSKLQTRDPEKLLYLQGSISPEPNPFFIVIQGPIEHWERIEVEAAKA